MDEYVAKPKIQIHSKEAVVLMDIIQKHDGFSL